MHSHIANLQKDEDINIYKYINTYKHKTWIQKVKINENAAVSIIYLFYETIYSSIYYSTMIDYKLLYNLYTMDFI